MTVRRRGRGGETYLLVKGDFGNDGPYVRCRSCETVVPFVSWWLHVCGAPGRAPGEVRAPGMTPRD